MYRVEVLADNNDSNYWYFGVISRSWTNWSSAMNSAGVWTLQADGYIYDNGSGSGTGNTIRSGDRAAFVVDLGARSIEFFKNGTSIRRCALNTGEVCMAMCFGGSGQRFTITVRAVLGVCVLFELETHHVYCCCSSRARVRWRAGPPLLSPPRRRWRGCPGL